MSDISMFEPRNMIAALKQIAPPSNALLDTFFPTIKQHTANKIDIDIIDATGRKMAPYCSPKIGGIVMKSKGFSTKTISLPYIKIKTPTSALEALSRQPGETIYDNAMNPMQRAAAKLGEDMAESRDQILRRLEWNAAQLLDTGKITISENGVELEVDFGMKAAHKETLTGTALWSNAASDPITDLEGWAEMQGQDSGIYPTDCIMGADALAAFRTNTAVRNYLDNRNISIGQLAPAAPAKGLRFIMRLDSAGLDIWSYAESYYDEDNATTAKFVPAKKVWLCSRNAYTAQHYGLVKDLKAGSAAVRFFAKTWQEEDPSVQWLLVQSAPLVAMHQPDAFGSYKVLS